MSTTAVITPYDPETEKRRNDLAIKEEKSVAKFREEMRKNRLIGTKLPVCGCSRLDIKNSSMTINTPSIDFVRKAAEEIGYTARVIDRGNLILSHKDGSLISISKTNTGKVTLTNREPDVTPAEKIVREHMAMLICGYQKSIGMDVRAKRTQFGEITIEAQTKKRQKVFTDIREDGVAVVDVSGVKGKGCQEIINGITRAVKGEQIDITRKSEYFLITDEERHINV